MHSLVEVITFTCFLAISLAQSAPFVYWNNQPVQTNETVLVFGSGLTNATVNLCDSYNTNCINPTILDSWDSSIKFTIPDNFKNGAYYYSVCEKSSCSPSYGINTPEVWWIESDFGAQTKYWLKIFGRSLGFQEGECVQGSSPSNETGTIVILDNGSKQYNITSVLATCYDIYAEIPPGLFGTYNVSVLNALSPKATSIQRDGSLIQISVISTTPFPANVFDVRRDFNGNMSAAVEAANNSPGGGMVYVSKGNIYMKDQEVLTLNDMVYITGDSSVKSHIFWESNSVAPSAPLITLNGRFGFMNIAIYASSPCKQVIHATANASGFINLAAISRDSPTDIANVFQLDGSNIQITNSFFFHGGNCSNAGWPANCGFWLNATTHVQMIGNTFSLRCQGYAGFGVDKLLMEGNTILSASNKTVDGSGFSTLGHKMYSEKISFLRNMHHGDLKTPVRYETYTSDGPGEAYFGRISPSQSTSTSLSLLSNATLGENNFTRAGVVVLNGTGAGQVRRVASYSPTTFTLETPLDVQLDETSVISIIPYRGELILSGNHWKNGTAVQVFGASYYTVIADNILKFMMPSKQIHPAGIASWGLDYAGVQPTYFTEIYGNAMENAGAITAVASFGGRFTGAYLRAHVIRRNSLNTTTFIDIMGSSSDFVIEANSVTGLLANQTAIQVAQTTDHILIR